MVKSWRIILIVVWGAGMDDCWYSVKNFMISCYGTLQSFSFFSKLLTVSKKWEKSMTPPVQWLILLAVSYSVSKKITYKLTNRHNSLSNNLFAVWLTNERWGQMPQPSLMSTVDVDIDRSSVLNSVGYERFFIVTGSKSIDYWAWSKGYWIKLNKLSSNYFPKHSNIKGVSNHCYCPNDSNLLSKQ